MSIELYRLVEGSNVWTLTSGDKEVTYNAEVYTPIPIGRSQIETVQDMAKAYLEVTIGLDDTLATRWLPSIIDKIVSLTVFSHTEDETIVIWKGRMSAVKPERSTLTLVFENVFTSLRRPGLRQRYQRTCPHVLYGRGCNLDAGDFAIATDIASVNGVLVESVEAALRPNGFFTGGMVEATDGSRRFIVSHVGATLRLIRPLESLQEEYDQSVIDMTTLNINIYPGCDRSPETCDSRFSNILNYGGFPNIPGKNPFDGEPIT